MKLNNLIKDLHRDKRMKEWNTRHSTNKKHQEDLRNLPDLSDQAESMINNMKNTQKQNALKTK